MLDQRNSKVDILAIGLLAATLFVAISLLTYDRADRIGQLMPPLDRLYQADVLVYPQNERIQNACGYLGALIADVLYSGLGFAALFVVVGMAAAGTTLIWRQKIQSLWSRTIGWVLVLLGVTTLLQLTLPEQTLGPIIGSGGYVGALTKGFLSTRFAFAGSVITAAGLLIAGLLLWTDYLLVRWLTWIGISIWGAVTYLLPLEWLARGKLSASSVGHPSMLGTQRHRKQDDLNLSVRQTKRRGSDSADRDFETETPAKADEEQTELFKDLSVDKRGLRLFSRDRKRAADPTPKIEQPADTSEHPVKDEANPSVVVVVPPANTRPFVLKTAAKNAIIPKMFRGSKHRETPTEPAKEDAIEADNLPVQLAGPHFRPKETGQSVEHEQQSEARDKFIERLNQVSEFDDAQDYQLPDIQLLTSADAVSIEEKRLEAMRKGELLEKAFKDFGLKVRVVDFETGPVITQFELELESGLRLSKVTGLGNDIAIALRVPSVRVVAPIPGKNTVGVEVPNDNRQTVRLREVIEDTQERTRKMKIPLFLGKDVAGEPMIADLASLPHLLIAGRTGTGKSVCLNAIISSILMTRRPDEVRMLMIDPKMVELSGYGRLPHLMHPVVTDMRKAEAILAWAVDKMEERYMLLARAGVRHISSYNQLSEEEIVDRLQPQDDEERHAIPLNLPFIVIVADEMADLMMTAGKEVEQHIIRLAQKSRAVGIHLILATQKPTVDVITGLIKSNLPARISFQVASRTDSRVVLDEMGADKLLGNGDMLFLWPGTSTLIRGQGTFLSDDEIQAITDAVSTTEQNFVNELINLRIEDDSENPGSVRSVELRDELYHQAVETVIQGERGSISLLQKNLGIGYGRAARLIDFMEEDGIVGSYNGSKSREVLIDMLQWERIKNRESDDRREANNPQNNGPIREGSHPSNPSLSTKPKRPTPLIPEISKPAMNLRYHPSEPSIRRMDPDDEADESDLEDSEPSVRPRVVRATAASDTDPEGEIVEQVRLVGQHSTADEILDDEEWLDEEVDEESDEEDDDVADEAIDEETDDEEYEYEYEYVEEDELEDGEDYEIEYQYIDDELDEDSDSDR